MEILILIFLIVAPGTLVVGTIAFVFNHRWLRSVETRLPSRKAGLDRNLDTLDCGTLAGTPRRILHSDRSGPGAVLRDELMNRPSGRDS